MSHTSVDPAALAEFIETTGPLAASLDEMHLRLGGERGALTGGAVVPPPGLGSQAVGPLGGGWRHVSDAAERVLGLVAAADGWPTGSGPPGAGVGFSDPDDDLSERVAALARERDRLDDLRREGGRLDRHVAGQGMGLVEDELARLAPRLDVEGWRQVSRLLAGFDPDTWDPERGLAHNDGHVRAIYTFYGELYLRDPDLLWTGMAALAGRVLYAGWQDLTVVQAPLGAGSALDYAVDAVSPIELPGPVVGGLDHADWLVGGPVGAFRRGLSQDLSYYEIEFLTMAGEVFDDMAWMHVAYLYGGPAVLPALLVEDGQGPDLTEAWADLDDGEPTIDHLLDLTEREQSTVLDDNWQEIVGRRGYLSGLPFTKLLTLTAANPVPGGRSAREVMDRPFPYSPPGFPDGNVAYLDDRWKWIEEDMGPAFLQLAEKDPELLEALLRAPIDDTVDPHRKVPLPYVGDD